MYMCSTITENPCLPRKPPNYWPEIQLPKNAFKITESTEVIQLNRNTDSRHAIPSGELKWQSRQGSNTPNLKACPFFIS